MAKRGPKLLLSIKKLIASEAISYRGKPREALAVELLDKIAHMEIMVERDLPSKEYVMRLISEYRNKEDSSLDNHWHLGTIEEYPLSADTISLIFELQNYMEPRNDLLGFLSPFGPFGMSVEIENSPDGTYVIKDKRSIAQILNELTIRQARWAAKLHVISREYSLRELRKFKDKKETKAKTETFIMFNLERHSRAYADYERICEIAGIDFDTSELDEGLRYDDFDDAVLRLNPKSKKEGEK